MNIQKIQNFVSVQWLKKENTIQQYIFSSGALFCASAQGSPMLLPLPFAFGPLSCFFLFHSLQQFDFFLQAAFFSPLPFVFFPPPFDVFLPRSAVDWQRLSHYFPEATSEPSDRSNPSHPAEFFLDESISDELRWERTVAPTILP